MNGNKILGIGLYITYRSYTCQTKQVAFGSIYAYCIDLRKKIWDNTSENQKLHENKVKGKEAVSLCLINQGRRG
jgi:hypothetical protein